MSTSAQQREELEFEGSRPTDDTHETLEAIEQPFTPFDVKHSLIPLKCDGVSVRESTEDDDTHLTYEPGEDGLYLMNKFGKVVFDLCDGSRCVSAIISEIRSTFSVSETTDLDSAIRGYLAILRARHLIRFAEE